MAEDSQYDFNFTFDFNYTYDFNYTFDLNFTYDPDYTFPGLPDIDLEPPCPIYKVYNGLIGVLFSFAAIIMVIMSALEVRRRLCINCCYGRPGLPVPLNFLINPKHRWIYVFIFPTMATSMYEGFSFIVAGELDANIFSHLFWKLLVRPLLVVIFLSIQYSPLFVCADAPVEIVGHIIGLLYAIVWFALYLSRAAGDYIQLSGHCFYQDDFSKEYGLHEDIPAGVTVILSDIPIVIASALILMWYIYQVIMDIYRCIKKPQQENSSDVNETLLKARVNHYHISYVKKLLKKPNIKNNKLKSSRMTRLFTMIKEVWNRDSRLPIPFIGALLGGFAIAYELALVVMYSGFTTAHSFSGWYHEELSKQYIDVLNSEIISELANTTITALPVSAVISPLVGLLAVLMSIIMMVINVSNEVRQIRREGFKEHLPAPHKRVAASWKFIGYQMGTVLYGWGVYTALAFAVCVIITGLTYLLKLPELRSWAITSTVGLIVPAAWAFGIFFIQGQICKYFFFQDKNPGKFLTIKYHRIFNCFAFVLIFYNGLAGVLAAVLRGLLSIAFGLVLFIRLDRNILMKGFEIFDKGHSTYLGFFYMDYCYNNAVIHVFLGNLAQLIVPHHNTKYKDSDKGAEEILEFAIVDPPTPADDQSNETPTTRRKIHNRWLVAYTLVRNPSLIPLTASNLEAANMKKRLYDHEVKSDVDNDEKVTLESVKVDLSDLDNIKQERDIGTNL